jgi:hypothetical protein
MIDYFHLRCPECGSSDQIDVNASIWARVTNDGTDPNLSKDGTHEWDDDSPARCAACGHSGKTGVFRQNEYMAYFRTTAGIAHDIFIGHTPEQALRAAQDCFQTNPEKLGITPGDMAELQEIRLVSEEAEEVLTWMTDEYRLQLYAPDLLKALESQVEATRGIIDAWENTDCLPEAVQDLIDALDRQSEYARAVLDAWENSDLVGAISGLEDSLAAALKAIADAKGGAA